MLSQHVCFYHCKILKQQHISVSDFNPISTYLKHFCCILFYPNECLPVICPDHCGPAMNYYLKEPQQRGLLSVNCYNIMFSFLSQTLCELAVYAWN